jgi:hypothetical protein
MLVSEDLKSKYPACVMIDTLTFLEPVLEFQPHLAGAELNWRRDQISNLLLLQVRSGRSQACLVVASLTLHDWRFNRSAE